MTLIHLTIDDEVVMNNDLGTWSTEPPALTDLKLKTGNQPWAIPAIQVIAHAAIHQQDTVITVHTHTGGWSITVNTDQT